MLQDSTQESLVPMWDESLCAVDDLRLTQNFGGLFNFNLLKRLKFHGLTLFKIARINLPAGAMKIPSG